MQPIRCMIVEKTSHCATGRDGPIAGSETFTLGVQAHNRGGLGLIRLPATQEQFAHFELGDVVIVAIELLARRDKAATLERP